MYTLSVINDPPQQPPPLLLEPRRNVYDYGIGVLPIIKEGGRIWAASAALPAEPDPITYSCTLRGSDSTGALRSLAQLRPYTEWPDS